MNGRNLLTVLALWAAASAQASDARDAAAFEAWRAERANAVAVEALEIRLGQAGVAGLIPPHLLLRSARDWERCGAEPFAVPPVPEQVHLVKTLRLIALLRQRGLMPRGEPVSAYRNPALNRCASGAAQSAHMSASAIDFAHSPEDADIVPGLCAFWRSEGPAWDMGMTVYNRSGNIHIDTSGHRTWGSVGEKPVCATP